MRRASLLLMLALCGTLQAKTPKTRPNPGMDYLDTHFARYDAIQKRIHGYAEPGYLEFRSSKELASHLEANGFTIEWGVAGIPTAFVASFGSGKPCVGLLGEYDALPGMSQDTSAFRHPEVEGGAGHACGHNLLGTATAASAVAISKWLAEGREGTVKYFGCPAEEGGGGKYYMTAAGCSEGCDAVLDWHPGDANSVDLSPWQANMRVNFNFHGKAAHAGGAPWDGRSALDAVESFDYMMNLMREHLPLGCRVHYIITNGGKAPNVVPDEAQVVYYFRHRDARVVRDIFSRAVDAARGAAMGTGTTMDYEIVNACYEKLVNRRLSEIVLKNLKAVGGVSLDAREAQFIREVRKAAGDSLWQDVSSFAAVPQELTPAYDKGLSTDVGNVSQVVPLASLQYATMPDGTALHSWPVAAVGGSTVGTKALLGVAKVFYLTAVDLYSNPSAVSEVRAEYEAARGKGYKFIPLMDRKPPLEMNVKN